MAGKHNRNTGFFASIGSLFTPSNAGRHRQGSVATLPVGRGRSRARWQGGKAARTRAQLADRSNQRNSWPFALTPRTHERYRGGWL